MTDRIHYVPRPYAGLAYDHIAANKRCALFAGMGLGKGVMTLSTLSDLAVTEDIFPALAVGPLRVARDVWPKETAKWDHLSHLHCVPIVGEKAQRLRAVSYDSPIYSTNYEQLPWLVEHWGDRWPYRTVIVDESTKLKGYRGSDQVSKNGKEYVRGAGSIRARAFGKIAHTKVKRIIELTGTPAPNGLKDLWGQLWFLDAGERLGRTYTAFAQRWFSIVRNDRNVQYFPLAHADKEIHERINDICLTIDAKDWFDLKEPIVQNVYVDLPPDAMKAYREMEKDMFTQLADRTVEAFGAAAKTQKCLQIANGAAYIDPLVESDSDPKSKEWRPVHSAKLEALESIVEEANGAQIIVSYEFRSDLARILKMFPGSVDLSTSAGMAKFKAGKAQVGCGHPQSIGHGVDGLQDVCNIIVFFGHNWNLETYDQIIGRIGPVRQMQAGLDRPVFVYHVVASGTVDELVMERRDGKREVQDILLDAMKRRLSA